MAFSLQALEAGEKGAWLFPRHRKESGQSCSLCGCLRGWAAACLATSEAIIYQSSQMCFFSQFPLVSSLLACEALSPPSPTQKQGPIDLFCCVKGTGEVSCRRKFGASLLPVTGDPKASPELITLRKSNPPPQGHQQEHVDRLSLGC